MCGRLNVIDDPLCQLVSDTLGIEFKTSSNPDLCPSQDIATVIRPGGEFKQLDATWGIQPNWSKSLLINAQSETVGSKVTFKNAFQHSRCLVPCSGWFEWKTINGSKVKYSFTHADNQPFYMGGILYNPEKPQLVTLTTQPNKICEEIHKRMPVIIEPHNINYWFNANADELPPLMSAIDSQIITIEKC